MSMPGRRAEAEPREFESAGCLSPLSFIRVQASQGTERIAHIVVAANQLIEVGHARSDSATVDELAEAGAVAQKPEANLRICQRGQGLDQRASSLDMLPGVASTMVRRTQRSPEKLKVVFENPRIAETVDEKTRRKEAG